MSLARQIKPTTETAAPKLKEKPANAHAGAVPSIEEIFNLPVFGPADVFPMLGDDELQELADDIKANGQKEPIVIGEIEGENGEKTLMLIDGRNRREACRVAGVAPHVRQLVGEDPTAFVMSSNIHRRHMTKGQRAMAVAMIYPEAEAKGGRGKTSAKISEVSDRYIGMARTVLSFSRPLAQSVLAGMPLAEAYKEASLGRSDQERQVGRMNRLAKTHPEFAEAVSNGGMTLDEAEAKVKAAAEARKQQRWAYTKNICDAVMMLDRPKDTVELNFADFDPALAEQGGHVINADRLRNVATYVAALADLFEGSEGGAS